MARQAPNSIRLHASAPEPDRLAGHRGLTNDDLTGVLGALPFTVVVLDRSFRVVGYSGHAPPDSFLGRDAAALVSPEQHEFHERQLKRVLDGGEVVSYDMQLPAPADTPPQWVRLRLSPLAIGGDIRGVVCVSMSIEHERAVQRRADRLRATFDHVDEGVLVVDLPTGHVIECTRPQRACSRFPTRS